MVEAATIVVTSAAEVSAVAAMVAEVVAVVVVEVVENHRAPSIRQQ